MMRSAEASTQVVETEEQHAAEKFAPPEIINESQEKTDDTKETTEFPKPLPALEDDHKTASPAHNCKCDAKCTCRNPLVFTQRVESLPPVKAFGRIYDTVKTSNSVFNCLFTSAEAAALIATLPARLAAGPLRRSLATPVYVADLLLCKSLDLAERVFPCLKQDPSKTMAYAAVCACGVPAGVCYMSSKLACKGLRTCLCDLPAVACGVPALACCSAAEICLCNVPGALCYLPATVAVTAVRGVVGDAEEILKDANAGSELLVAQLGNKPKGGK